MKREHPEAKTPLEQMRKAVGIQMPLYMWGVVGAFIRHGLNSTNGKAASEGPRIVAEECERVVANVLLSENFLDIAAQMPSGAGKGLF